MLLIVELDDPKKPQGPGTVCALVSTVEHFHQVLGVATKPLDGTCEEVFQLGVGDFSVGDRVHLPKSALEGGTPVAVAAPPMTPVEVAESVLRRCPRWEAPNVRKLAQAFLEQAKRLGEADKAIQLATEGKPYEANAYLLKYREEFQNA